MTNPISNITYVHFANSKRRRGHEVNLTYEQFCSVWLHSEHREQRGNLPGQYSLARIDDSQPWSASNVHVRMNPLPTRVNRKLDERGPCSGIRVLSVQQWADELRKAHAK